MDTPINVRILDEEDSKASMRRQSSLKRAAAERGGQRLFLSWIEQDVENRLGFFRGGRYTSVNKVFSLVLGILCTAFFYGAVVLAPGVLPATEMFTEKFTRAGNLPTVVPGMLFFFWGMAMLFLKHRKIRFQRRALSLTFVPPQPEFGLNEVTARPVLERLHGLVDHPRHFLLLNRIERALSSLHNIGAISDVSAIIKTQAENDENQMASSHTLVNGLIWATPILGFIGTVLGLSQSIGNFTSVLGKKGGGFEALAGQLQEVTSGLSTAFETTLVALVCALIMQLYMNYLQHLESEFLDACNDYCHANVIARLRLTPDPAAPGPEARMPAQPAHP